MTRVLLRGGYVHTPADPHATALCLDGGTIVWTGDDDAAEHFIDNAEITVELEGRLVTPAFVDAHAHLATTGLASLGVDLGGTRSAAEALDRIAQYARHTDLPLVLGHGWDETTWGQATVFTGDEVARATGGRPAYLSRVDLHSAIVTGIAGRHGRVERDDHHSVRDAMNALITSGMREDAIGAALTRAAAHGIGLVHEMGAPHIGPSSDMAILERLAAEGRFPHTVHYWGGTDLDEVTALGCVGAAGDLCIDGAIGSRTAALHAPYTDDPSASGHLYLEADQVSAHLVACTERGLQAGFHVIGDRAASTVVAGFVAAAKRVGAPALVMGRHRLEHLEMVTPHQLEQLGALGVTASVQPLFDGFWGGPDGLYARRLGERAVGMNPYASMNRAGLPLAFGSDAPVTPLGPWAAVRAATWHHTESERMTARAAFNAHTRGGWRAAGRDDGGVIAVGAPATIAVFDVPGDLVVQTPDARVAAWSTDPRAGVPQLPDLHPGQPLPICLLTLVEGRPSHDPAGLVGGRR